MQNEKYDNPYLNYFLKFLDFARSSNILLRNRPCDYLSPKRKDTSEIKNISVLLDGEPISYINKIRSFSRT